MNRISIVLPGRTSFTLGLILLGIISAVSGDFIPGIQPLPSILLDIPLISSINATLLICLSAALFFNLFREISSTLLATYFAGWLLVAHIPLIITGSFDVTRLVALMEVAAIATALPLVPMRFNAAYRIRLIAARVCFGAMLVIFGVIHCKYHQFITSMIPAWIPFREVWPWITGSINIAAGLSLVTGVKMRMGGGLVGLMFASWVPIVNLPRNVASPESIEDWTATAMTVTLAGAAWLIAGLAALPKKSLE